MYFMKYDIEMISLSRYKHILTLLVKYPSFQNQNICSVFGKMEKDRHFEIGGSKNQNKCSVFPAAYKLVHLYTNLIFKHLNKNYKNPVKSNISLIYLTNSQYRTKYRQT